MEEKKVYQYESYIVTTHRFSTPTKTYQLDINGGCIGMTIHETSGFIEGIIEHILFNLFGTALPDLRASLIYLDENSYTTEVTIPPHLIGEISKAIKKGALKRHSEQAVIDNIEKQRENEQRKKERKDMSNLEEL